MARQVEFRRKLPQQFALTGMRSRTPIYEQYGSPGGFGGGNMRIPTLASLAQAPIAPEPRKFMPSVTDTSQFSDFGGGPGVSAGAGTQGGIDGPGVATDPNSVSAMVGNQMAGSMFGRGARGVGTKGLAALAMGIPTSAVLSAIPSLAISSMLSPLAIPGMIAGGIQSGNAAMEAQNAMQAENISPELTSQATKGIIDSTYTANPFTLAKNMFTKEPQKFAKQISELTITNAPFSSSGPDASGPTHGYTSDQNIDAMVAMTGRTPSTSEVLGSQGMFNPAMMEAAKQGFLPTNTTTNISGLQRGLSTAPPINSMLTTSPYVNQSATSSSSNQGDPVGIGGMTGLSATGRGDSGTPGSIGGTGGGGLEGASAYGGGETGDVGPGVGGDGGTYICTELHRQGLMSDETYKADAAYGASLPYSVMGGYSVFAIPLASAMAKSRIVTSIVKPFGMAWARHMAGDKNWFGAIAIKAGIPMCKAIFSLKCCLTRKNSTHRQHRV